MDALQRVCCGQTGCASVRRMRTTYILYRPSVLREAEGWEAEAEECDASMCAVRRTLGPEGFAARMRVTDVAPMTELQRWDYGFRTMMTAPPDH